MKRSPRAYPAHVARSVALIRLLGDPTRFQVMRMLIKHRSGLPVYAIADALAMSHSAVSHQLGVLEKGGVIAGRREGQTVLYRIARTRRARAAMHIVRLLYAI